MRQVIHLFLLLVNIKRSLKKYINLNTYDKFNERGIVTFLFSNPPLPNSLVYLSNESIDMAGEWIKPAFCCCGDSLRSLIFCTLL